MDLDDYSLQLDEFADGLDDVDGAWEIYVTGLQGVNDAEDCVTLREQLLTPQEENQWAGLLEAGYFPHPDRRRRLAWWAFTQDVIDRSDARSTHRSCEPYRPDQPLFIGAPSLFKHIRRREAGGTMDFELIDDKAIRAIQDSEIYRVQSGFARLAPHLAPSIPVWARRTYPAAPLYVRLDPSRHYRSQPRQRLLEAAIVPAKPEWMRTLALFPETTTFAQYELLGDRQTEGLEAYRDYAIRDIRRLEVRAQRREPDYLSMIIEELPRPDASNGLMIGRCIHLDTRAPIGTAMKDASLQHLDLAINVYTGADRSLRMGNTLQTGKSQSATYRTHLMRIERVPFPALFVFAEMFFKSQVLLREWRRAALPDA